VHMRVPAADEDEMLVYRAGLPHPGDYARVPVATPVVLDGAGARSAHRRVADHPCLVQPRAVMAGLDRAIHVIATGAVGAGNCVDARVKPAHYGLRLSPIKTQHPIPVLRTALRSFGNGVTPALLPLRTMMANPANSLMSEDAKCGSAIIEDWKSGTHDETGGSAGWVKDGG
jgi:hypothetical protein